MKDKIVVNFILPNGEVFYCEANEGESIAQIAVFHDLPLECACGGSLACSTCHVVVDEKFFEGMEVSDDENDMLDLAFGLQRTSRLGCQVILTKALDGITVRIPSDTKNFGGCCGGKCGC